MNKGLSLGGMIFALGKAWLRMHLLRRPVPLLVGWNLTFQCNLRCQYCASPSLKVAQLDSEAIFRALDAFYDLGMRWVTFSGGEPLMRKDIGLIINHAKSLGLNVFISTNGALIPQRIQEMRAVDRVTISLDGIGDTHDLIRGKGAFDKALRGIEVCQDHAIPVALTCVLSRHNLGEIDAVLAFAKEYQLHCMFQPATTWLDSSDKPNPVTPPVEPYREAIAHLQALKKQGAPITNSMAGLRYLAKWPDPTPMRSAMGWVSCTVEPDGKVFADHIIEGGSLEAEPGRLYDPIESYAQMSPPGSFDQPWCGPLLELDLLFALNPSAILNAVRMQA